MISRICDALVGDYKLSNETTTQPGNGVLDRLLAQLKAEVSHKVIRESRKPFL